MLYAVSAKIDYPLKGFPRYGVDKFMTIVSREVQAGALLLDAGAGHCPYKSLFNHAQYQSCDYMPVHKETGGATEIAHTFYCDLEKIPKDGKVCDVIICKQVLEHVRHPENVMGEFCRILELKRANNFS